MAIVCSFLHSPKTINVRVKKQCLLPACNLNKDEFPLSASFCRQDVEQLRAYGVTFTGLGDNGVVLRMALENGSAAKLMLPSGLITSFKAEMWHGATMELLHTTVVDGAPPTIQGGLSLALAFDSISWSPNAWSLHQVHGTPAHSIQVELMSSCEDGLAQVKHIITLGRDLLTSEILVSNFTNSSLHLMGSAICHLATSTPDATYALGLQGSDFFIRPPILADFSIIPPEPNTTGQLPWPLQKLSAIWESRKGNVKDNIESLVKDTKQELEGEEEEDNYKHLTERFSRIYTSAPRNLTIIDRGRRNSVTVERNGFQELYMFSPGSEHEWYGKYSYICIGHAALLEPIILNAQSEWSGGLQLWNPNS